MASPDPGRDVPNESERPEPSHPEPACQEAQKWIEAVTGKSFGDKDFRSGLENGILLCELLSAIKPGLVKKINRLPTPIAGLDNLSVFLRGCEELGLRGAQLFDPGDLQDTSVRANLKDSDCNRKLKNVLNTVFWLGKAANGVASYAGPSLNLKEFEGLLAQMKVDSGEEGESPQTRSVRDSGYDCWDSERSESLSPPRHTRDNSLDSLDSFGSRSQHSPSPDVVTRSNCDGRGSDSEADGRRPDVRKDDMSARRTASGESRSSVPFNQFLPNRTNAGSYIPAPRRKPSAEEGEQRSRPQASSDQSKRSGAQHKSLKTVTWAPENNEETAKQEEERVTQEVLEQTRLQKLQKAGIKVLPAVARYSSPSTVEEQGPRAPSPNIILRCQNDFLSSHKSAWDSPSDGESDEAETARVPDVRRDDLASRRAPRGPVASNVHQFVPRPACSSKDRERWEGIRRASQRSLQEKESSETEAADAGREEEEKKKKKEEVVEEEVAEAPSKQRDDLAQRRAQTRPLPQREGPARFVSATMSQADMQKWERLKMSDPSEAESPAPVCQACLEKKYGGPLGGASAKAGRGHSKVVTFGGVTELERTVGTAVAGEGEESGLLRRLLSKATVAMPTIGLKVSQLSEREGSQVDGTDLAPDLGPDLGPDISLPSWASKTPVTPAEVDARLAQYEQRAQEEDDDEEEEDEKVPDLQKDDMMARRTGVFHKQSATAAAVNRFLPLPASQRCTRGEVVADAAPTSKREVQVEQSKVLNVRADRQQAGLPMEPSRPLPGPLPDPPMVAGDEESENEPVPDPEKDDMMARRTGSHNSRANQGAKQFLPVPGTVRYAVSPVSAMKPLSSRQKVAEKAASGSAVVSVQAEPRPLPSLPPSAGLRKQQQEEEMEDGKQRDLTTLNPPKSLSSPASLPSAAAAPPAAQTCKVESVVEKLGGEEGEGEEEEEEEEDRQRNVNVEPRKTPFWMDDDDLPPMMMSRRVAFMSEETQSASMGDMISEEEVGYLPPMSQSRHEHMHEQYNSFVEDEDHWRDDLTRWKNRRRSASQELIKKEEERKRMEKRMKEEGGDKRKSIKTYKEIVEDKERREAELCVAYRSAATPEEAAMVLQRYALRFTISDATLDSLKVPRSAANSKIPADEHKPESNESEPAEQNHAEPAEAERSSAAPHQQMSDSSTSSPTLSPVTISNDVAPESQQKSADVTAEQQQPQQQQQQQQPQQQQQVAGDLKPLSKHTPQMPQPRPNATQPVHHTLPSPQSGACRTLPLLAAKPYCQPRASQSGHKPVKMDGLMRVNGEATDVPVSAPAPAPSAQHTAEDVRDASSSARQGDLPSEVTRAGQEAEQLEEEEAETAKTEEQRPSSGAEEQPEPLQRDQEAETQQEEVQMEEQKAPTQPEEQTLKDVAPSPPPPSRKEEHTPPKPPRHPESVPTFSGSAISSLIGGRNRVVTTTIVTELTQTRVEPLQPEGRTNGQVNGSSEELKAQPASPTAASSSSSTQDFSASVTESLDESSVTEQYRQEQEKLKQEWERAQLEVEEEERKHNEEERRILEETVTPLTPASLLNQQPGQTAVSPPGTAGGKADALKNSQIIPAESAEQHASKLHFFQDSALDGQPVKKQELLKTASLDRNPQLNQPHIVKRSESHEDVTRKASGQPPSPSRCVSGKRLCSGCSQPLGKGAAMNIDTLGLFFHMQCFKCGGCSRQMGDATAGTDVRIRNGHLSCHECYIATRGRGQPTTL
ncbi:uncharacterized protein LOC142893754 isoform X4 [Nelusetta ayraudi]|uniref:uncharacterized protein LOC142893754 isoform X4 n=1 Tax=Nelusetta ayraudi TaxID=303726 RepID=UPI003F6F374E